MDLTRSLALARILIPPTTMLLLLSCGDSHSTISPDVRLPSSTVTRTIKDLREGESAGVLISYKPDGTPCFFEVATIHDPNNEASDPHHSRITKTNGRYLVEISQWDLQQGRTRTVDSAYCTGNYTDFIKMPETEK